MRKLTKRERFADKVLSRYQVYNSIFSTLPYESITNTGVMLPLFEKICIEGYKKNRNPSEIVEVFFKTYLNESNDKERIDLLFHFIQYIERQVVLFDAIEDAAFTEINNLEGRGSLRALKEEVESKNKIKEFKKYLSKFKIRPVLTAHPTQFYPGSVLGIITDLTSAVKENNLSEIKSLLSQLGKTPFFKNKKPSPFDEAVSLTWYLENVFYSSITNIYKYIKSNVFNGEVFDNDIINLGFWPGGDRDGNPFVTTEITINTARKLIEAIIIDLETRLYESILDYNEDPKITLNELKKKLYRVREILISEHKSLFLDQLDDVIIKVNIFGYHFATLDIRQDSRIHSKVFERILEVAQQNKIINKPISYDKLTVEDKIKFLSTIKGDLNPDSFKDNLVNSTLSSIRAMKLIQRSNGEKGSNRYIISNNQSALNIIELFTMFRLSNWSNPSIDIVPLFETISDLKVAAKVMESVYLDRTYRNHLKNRGDKQTIMLGFSEVI